MAIQCCRSARFGQIGRSLAASLIVAAALIVAAEPSRGQDFVMKFATQTINDLQHEYIKVYKTELEKATNNRIRVDVYPASQLGGAQRQTEGLRLGTIEAAIGPAELFVGADPRFQAIAMAGLFKDLDHARRAIDLPQVKQAIFELAAQRHLVGIAANVYDMQSFVFKAPVSKLADFAGKRIRVLASEGEQTQVAALGGSSVPMSLPEVLPALQQGTIDGVNSVTGVFVAFKYYDAATNLLDSHLWALVSTSLVSKLWFDRLPPDLQKAVRETGAKIEPGLNKWQTARIAADTSAWKANGGKVVQLSAAEQQEAERRASAAIQPILDKSAPLKEFYNKIKAGAATVN
jgi:TRAP-type transport system periplasmic protein